MRFSTRLRLLSMKSDIRGSVAKIILDNVEGDGDLEIARWMKYVSANGCMYSNVRGLKYDDEVKIFYEKHKMDIELIIWDWETNNENLQIMGNRTSIVSWFAFREVIEMLINNFKIK